MKKFKKHIFICENIRSADDEKKSCGRADSSSIKRKFKERLTELGLAKEIRANTSGCLGNCKYGPIAVVYPEGIWYQGITEVDVEEIIQSHLTNNIPVDRLILKDE